MGPTVSSIKAYRAWLKNKNTILDTSAPLESRVRAAISVLLTDNSVSNSQVFLTEIRTAFQTYDELNSLYPEEVLTSYKKIWIKGFTKNDDSSIDLYKFCVEKRAGVRKKARLKEYLSQLLTHMKSVYDV